MQSLLMCLVLLACLGATLAVPTNSVTRYQRSPYPARTMLVSGYFRGQHPQQRGFRNYSPRNYEPEGAMTAFAAGNTVSAGSYYGNGNAQPVDCNQCNGETPAAAEIPIGSPPELIPTTHEDGYPEEGNVGQEEVPVPESPIDVPSDKNAPEEPEEALATAPAPPSNGNGHGNDGRVDRPKQKPRSDEDESDEDEDDSPSFFPGKKPRGRGSFYNSYFPMIFGTFPGSYNGGRNGGGANGGSEGTYNPGVATAIANSFSTGRGAVATSHATAYGGPHFLSNGSKKGSSCRPDHNKT